ncbi:MAG: hypothetical protein ACLTOV_10665 [Phocaeicola sp.]
MPSEYVGPETEQQTEERLNPELAKKTATHFLLFLAPDNGSEVAAQAAEPAVSYAVNQTSLRASVLPYRRITAPRLHRALS